MNASTPSDHSAASQKAATHPALAQPRKKRRWWLYLLGGAAALVVLLIGLLIAAASYWNSLLRTYSSPEPMELPKVAVSPRRAIELRDAWREFVVRASSQNALSEFRVSAEDLNAMIADMGGLRDRVVLGIQGSDLTAQFSFPVPGGNPQMQGRYFNGRARFALTFTDGQFRVTLTNIEVNGKPIPHWLFRRLKKRNFADRLVNNPGAAVLFQKLERVEVRDGFITFTPQGKL
jgi:hypothetical protein